MKDPSSFNDFQKRPRCLWVPGIPKPQPRARAAVVAGRPRIYDPGTAEGWKGLVMLALREEMGEEYETLGGPISIPWMEFLFPRPKRLDRKRDPDGLIPHTSKPDLDNLTKAVLDALTEVGFWRDDSQVYSASCSKYYVARDRALGRTKPGLLMSVSKERG